MSKKSRRPYRQRHKRHQIRQEKANQKENPIHSQDMNEQFTELKHPLIELKEDTKISSYCLIS